MKICTSVALFLLVGLIGGWSQDDTCPNFNRCKKKEATEKISCPGCKKKEIYKDFALCMSCGVRGRLCVKCGRPKKGAKGKAGGGEKGSAKESKKKPKGTADAVKKALEFLAKKQSGDGSWDTNMAATTGKVSVTSMAALALMASSNKKYAANIQKAAKYVRTNLFAKPGMNDPKWDQTNWQVCFGTLFLAEAYAAGNKDLKPILKKAVTEIFNRQEASGGWGHSNSGPNALNYVELEVMSTLALGAVGALKREGFEVPKDKIAKAFKFIEDCCNKGEGAVGYSPRRGQKGMGEEGRTGGAIWLYGLHKRKGDKLYKNMTRWWQKHLDGATNGHGSIALGCFGSALGGRQLQGKDWDSFVETVFPKLLQNQNGDGSFKHLTGTGAGAMGGDSGVGVHYNTGIYLLVLQMDLGNLSYVGGAF